MSRSHGRAIAQNFNEFAQILDYYMGKLKKICILTYFYTYYVILGVIFALFLTQNFKN